MIRKGSRALQMLPASATRSCGFGCITTSSATRCLTGAGDAVWWTLRRPHRPLSYDAARMMFTRVQQSLGFNWSLHDLRHSAAYHMVSNPRMSLVDIQWCLATPTSARPSGT